MMRPMPTNSLRKALVAALVTLSMAFGSPGAAMAQDEEEKPDARLEGYLVNGQVSRVMIDKPRSTALTWFGLGILGIGVMFKGGKRTHLD
jgi:hypothetical protein